MKIELKKRTAKCTNMNFKPETHGDEKVERVDLSLEFLMSADELDALLTPHSAEAGALLWSGDDLMFPTLARLVLDIKGEGVATIGTKNAREPKAYDEATIKKLTVEPMIGKNATVRCQVRIDPTGRLEELGKIVLDDSCQFGFAGEGAATEPESQGKLNV